MNSPSFEDKHFLDWGEPSHSLDALASASRISLLSACMYRLPEGNFLEKNTPTRYSSLLVLPPHFRLPCWSFLSSKPYDNFPMQASISFGHHRRLQYCCKFWQHPYWWLFQLFLWFWDFFSSIIKPVYNFPFSSTPNQYCQMFLPLQHFHFLLSCK